MWERVKGAGDGACFRICLGSSKTGVPLEQTVLVPLQSLTPNKCNKDLLETSEWKSQLG